MNLLEEFCNEIGLRVPVNIKDVEYRTDMTGFNIVDGEEGDNGIIKYFSSDELLLAIKINYGGDHSEIEFTNTGVELLKKEVLRFLNKSINDIETICA